MSKCMNKLEFIYTIGDYLVSKRVIITFVSHPTKRAEAILKLKSVARIFNYAVLSVLLDNVISL